LLDHLNELLLDECLPVVHEDMQCLETGTMRNGSNEFLLDLNQWCLLFEPYALQVDDNSSVTSSGITSWGKERQSNSVSHKGEEAMTTVELEECDSRVESAPEPGEEEIMVQEGCEGVSADVVHWRTGDQMALNGQRSPTSAHVAPTTTGQLSSTRAQSTSMMRPLSGKLTSATPSVVMMGPREVKANNADFSCGPRNTDEPNNMDERNTDAPFNTDDNLVYLANGITNVDGLLAGNAIVVDGQLRSGGARDGTNDADAEQPRAEGTKYAHRETPSADVLDSSSFTTSQSAETTMTDESAEIAESKTIGVTGSEADRITGPVVGQLRSDGARDCINGRQSFTTSQSTTPTDDIESTQHKPADVPDSTPSTTNQSAAIILLQAALTDGTKHTPADVPDSTSSTTRQSAARILLLAALTDGTKPTQHKLADVVDTSTTSQSSLTNSLGVEALADDIVSVQHTPCETSPIDAT